MGAFVTGSTGLLGNNLVRTLLKAGHEVGRFGQIGSEGRPRARRHVCAIVIGDMADVAGFADALEGVDAVFRTAACFREYYAPGDHSRIIEDGRYQFLRYRRPGARRVSRQRTDASFAAHANQPALHEQAQSGAVVASVLTRKRLLYRFRVAGLDVAGRTTPVRPQAAK
jgi:hypothetical protein